MTRSGKSPRLAAHIAEPFVELHPEDACRLGIGPAEIAEISSDQGRAFARVHITPRQQRGSIFMPMHWTDRFGSNGRANAVIAAVTDPLSGQPAFKAAQVGIRRFPARTYGFAVSCSEPHSISAPYSARAVCPGGWRIEFASSERIDDPLVWLRKIIALEGDTEVLAYQDRVRGDCRLAAFSRERLKAMLFLSSEPVAVSRSFAAEQLGLTHDDAAARLRILAGRPAADQLDPGPTVCSCFTIGLNQIVAEVASGTCHDIESVGRVLKAGTSCGSCRSEIKGILEAHCRASPSAAANIA
jgi:assimilatory nitrate reductase catalytic subunit